MTLDEIRIALQDRRLPVISKRTGLHHNTLAAIRNGTTKDPSYRVMETLIAYFQVQ